MIILSTAATENGRATLSRGYSYTKNERWELRNEEMWERNRGGESKTLTRGKSHSNEIGSIWIVCSSHTQTHIYWPHLIMDHQSETGWAREGGSQRSHMKGDWDALSFWHCNSQSSKLSPLESSICFFGLLSGFFFLSAPFCFDRKKKEKG